jgi:hypothetical protein
MLANLGRQGVVALERFFRILEGELVQLVEELGERLLGVEVGLIGVRRLVFGHGGQLTRRGATTHESGSIRTGKAVSCGLDLVQLTGDYGV